MVQEEIINFKHLLEYYVSHLNYIQSNDAGTAGYSEYIEPFIKKQTFKITGQGYAGNSIQNQISKWQDYHSHLICINVQGHYGKNYTTKKCYLNWKDTGININANWANNKVASLSICYCFPRKNNSQEYIDIISATLSDLGLYEQGVYNNNLTSFYQKYLNEIIQYDNSEGAYYQEVMRNNKEYNKRKMDIVQDKFINILLANHNLILTGAPGTGKTYLAMEIAKAMGAEGERVGFVQFHPSYDYTDFVEGLRPLQDSNGNLGFERKDGAFKEFCKKAIYSSKYNSNSNFEDCWDRLIELIKAQGKTQMGKQEYELSHVSTLKMAYGTLTKDNIWETFTHGKGRTSGGFQTYMNDVVSFMKEQLGLTEYQGKKPNSTIPYVFIIDEINRGEISKIFGELFFSIDPGYRGAKQRVSTQYQNMIDDDDVFKEGFYVPENVYIIGTMNDIDRSVESMDFAFRRRFAFKEIKAEDNVGMLDELDKITEGWTEKAINRMKHLNAAIEKVEGLSSAYHLGASYFLKLKNYKDAANPFGELWDNHIAGLLFEYLRGVPDAAKTIDDLKRAYDDESAEDNG